MCAAMLFASCGTTDSSEDTQAATSSKTGVIRSSERQKLVENIESDKKPELIKVEFSGICKDEIKHHARLSDIYETDYRHNGVVGLIGSPIELKYDSVDEAQITFYYAKTQLRGIPEKNLLLMCYANENESYKEVKSAKLDTAACTVSAPISEQGVYLLLDAYTWYSTWGMDASQYAYDVDKTSFDTDWERECDTGSIMKLADKDWAKKNAPDFHVSTPEQLASAVYYVNGVNSTYGKVNITLEKDIDLTGYDWRPMGWNKASNHGFYGTVNGNGHIIKGMKIKCDYEQCGFIGYGMDITVKDISFINSDVTGTHSTGIAGGEIYGTSVWTNVYVQGKVSGGGEYGAIVGRESAITFKDCSADVTVDGKPFDYFSNRQKHTAETPVVEYYHLKRLPDGVIVRDDRKDMECTWHIELDGVQILERGTTDPRTGEPELELPTDVQWLKGTEGKHTIYLVSYIDGGYVRVSNIIEYEGTGLDDKQTTQKTVKGSIKTN